MRIPAFQGLLIPFLLTMVVAGGIAGCAMNPVSGTPDLVFMSESSEINIGSENDAKIRGKYGVYDSPALQTYVQQVGQKLAAQSHRPGLSYHFTVPRGTACASTRRPRPLVLWVPSSVSLQGSGPPKIYSTTSSATRYFPATGATTNSNPTLS